MSIRRYIELTIVLLLCVAFIWQPAIVHAVSDLFLYLKVRNDPAYEVAWEIEAAHPGVYVVSVQAVDLPGDAAAAGVHWTYDREIYEPWRQAQREAGNNDAVAEFAAEANRACILAATDQFDNDYLYVAVVAPYQPDVLTGNAWVAVELLGVGGTTENMVAWAESGAQLKQARDFSLFVYVPTPYSDQQYLHEYMDRPWQTPPWEADVAKP